MPDVIFYNPSKKWLVLIEAVTSHGSINGKRQLELDKLFSTNLKKIFFSIFPNKQSFSKYSQDIAWETNVWIADNATHMIHFNGNKFIG